MGFLSKIAGIAAPVVGGFLGGPAGAQIGAALGGALGSRGASNTLAGGYNQASGLTQEGLNALNQAYSPYLQSGTTALNQLQNFGPEALQQDPGYAFRMNMGNKYARGLANASGRGYLSGNSLSGLLNFNQGLASQEYQNAYNRVFGRAQMGAQALGGYSQALTGGYNNLSNLAAGLGAGQAGLQQQGNTFLGSALGNFAGSKGGQDLINKGISAISGLF